MGITFQYNESTLARNLEDMAEKIGAAVLLYAATQAKVLEGQMKQNRPWTDRTGRAKSGLSGTATKPNDETVRITLSHEVDYGKWLELAHEKRYAIIAPTIRQESPRVIEGMQNIMSKITM